jgi:hypothetical protein
MYKNGIPQFDGQNYGFWSIRMKTYIQAHGFEIWQSIVDGYTTPTIPPRNDKVMKLGQNNEIFMKEIQKSKQQSFKLTEVSSNN